MKRSLIFFLLFINFSMAQTNVGIYRDGQNFISVPEEMVINLKKDTLHIICPSYIDQNKLSEVVANSWTMSPSKIVSFKSFLSPKFNSKNRWVLGLSPNLTSKKSEFGWDIYDQNYKLELSFIETSKFQKAKEKLLRAKGKVEIKNVDLLAFEDSKKVIARSWLHDYGYAIMDIHDKPSKNFREELLEKNVINASQEKLEMSDLTALIYNKNYFTNINLGAYKNYLNYFEIILSQNRQSPSNLISFVDSNQIKNLSNHILFVPLYLDKRYNTYRRKFYNDPKWLRKKFNKKYNYEYKTISSDSINEMILSDSEFYYLRYTANKSWQYMEIVNSATGKIIFTHKVLGSSNFSDFRISHLKALNKAIESKM